MAIHIRIAPFALICFVPAAVLAEPRLACDRRATSGLSLLLLGMVFLRLVRRRRIALWHGFDNLFQYLVYTAVAGGTLATALSMLRSVPLPGMLLAQAWVVRLHRRDAGIRYGVALAAGALLVYPHTFLFACLAG